ELVELEEGEYWHFQLEGLEVRTPEGEVVGRLTAVLSTPAHDIYAVAGPRGEVLIPAVEEYVLEVNLERGVMTVKLPEIH
ncbi:MAG TPA: ribosome maturation factor RimM, partial [Candidatus Nitrosotenuis sp.]|nr:ribosome maturation factor RimM [Candidatus Nitrosotenuis sp.]